MRMAARSLAVGTKAIGVLVKGRLVGGDMLLRP